MLPITDKVRLDKWLWCVRIFKTRSISADACKSGDVKLNGKKLKPSYHPDIGEEIQVKKNGFNLIFRIDQLISRRVSAVLAEQCYENLTSEEELNKYNDWFIGKARPELREKGSGRPTKKERRNIDEYKDGQFDPLKD